MLGDYDYQINEYPGFSSQLDMETQIRNFQENCRLRDCQKWAQTQQTMDLCVSQLRDILCGQKDYTREKGLQYLQEIQMAMYHLRTMLTEELLRQPQTIICDDKQLLNETI